MYEAFLSEAEQYLAGDRRGGNEPKKLEWLFYTFCQKNGMSALNIEDLLPDIRELLYWASAEPALRETADSLLAWLHQESLSQKQKDQYVKALLEGFTKRTGDAVCDELNRMLCDCYEKNKEQFDGLLNRIREENEIIYALLLLRDVEKEDAWQQDIFEDHMHSFEDMEEYIAILEKTEIPSDMKDLIIRRGIGLLNQNLFQKKNYEIFDALIARLDRKDQWEDILGDFVRQLQSEAGNFDDGQLETACYVEQLLLKYAPGEVESILKREYDRRQKKHLPENVETEANVVLVEEQAAVKPVDDDFDDEEEKGNFWDSLLVGYPQGFLTGCVMYVCSYTLIIGHWKIAVGMIGMWVLFTLNYYYLTLHKKNQYSFWKNIGMTLLEGYLIQFVAALFLSQRIRLTYFVLMGILAVAIQVINIVRESMEKGED
ncbi:MAG: hypothetical protein LUF92_18145 [Clostridiales bacterium]|nr:hypothetical protein [Clostridiales bacterium]